MTEIKNNKMENASVESVAPEPSEGLSIESLEAQNKELLEQIEEFKKQSSYMLAERENIRKIAKKEVESAKDYAVTNFATDMLQVLENLDRALANLDPELLKNDGISSLHTGILLTKKEILNVFSRYGISKIEAEGKKFDHKFHHAVKTIADKTKENSLVVEVLQDGYIIKDRVLRASMVAIISND